jgi:hypothetical protein
MDHLGQRLPRRTRSSERTADFLAPTRTASTITSGGKQKPANAARATAAERGRRVLIAAVCLLPTRSQQLQQCRRKSVAFEDAGESGDKGKREEPSAKRECEGVPGGRADRGELGAFTEACDRE